MDRDLMLRCVDCGAEFEFTPREQTFYQDNGWNPPRRCKSCRVKRKPGGQVPYTHNHHGESADKKAPNHRPQTRDAGNAEPVVHGKFRVNCSSCGIETSIPFKPDPKRPAFCKACLAKSKAGKR